MILLLAVSCIIGLGLLFLVYQIPTGRMKQHVRTDMEAMMEEGNYTDFFPQFFVRMHPGNISLQTFFLNNRGMARDNYTDSIMLGNAIYEDTDSRQSTEDKVLLVPRYEGEKDQPLISLQKYVEQNNRSAVTVYPRYWHGYLVILKPLLYLMTYFQIRILNVILQGLLFVLLLFRLHKILPRQGAVPLLFSALMIFPLVVPFCLQYSTMVYITLAASLVLVAFPDYWMASRRFLYLFFMIGILTSYMDFLTYPVLSLGVPLVLLSALCEKQRRENRSAVSEKTRFLTMMSCAAMWALGYGSFWAMKWVIATALSSQNVIADAMHQALHRTYGGSDNGAAHVSALQTLAANLCCYTNVIFLVLLALFALWVFWPYIRNRAGFRKAFAEGWSYLFPACLPFAWYLVLKSHSYDHSSFTYRAMMVSFLAVGMWKAESLMAGREYAAKSTKIEAPVKEAGTEREEAGNHGRPDSNYSDQK